MSRRQFNRVSFFLLIVLGLCALEFIPGRYPDVIRARTQSLFAPIAMPVRAFAGWVHGKSGAHQTVEPDPIDRSLGGDALRTENTQLRIMVASLQAQLDRAGQQAAELSPLGPLASECA